MNQTCRASSTRSDKQPRANKLLAGSQSSNTTAKKLKIGFATAHRLKQPMVPLPDSNGPSAITGYNDPTESKGAIDARP